MAMADKDAWPAAARDGGRARHGVEAGSGAVRDGGRERDTRCRCAQPQGGTADGDSVWIGSIVRRRGGDIFLLISL